MTVKYFTVEEANRTLPLVKRIVADIVEDYRVWKERVARYEVYAAAATEAETADQRDVRMDVERLAERINTYMEELDAVGCVFKGFDEGLVDFYGRLDGRDVLWCWKLGEPEVEYWHEVDAGVAGRQPLERSRVGGEDAQ
jgi:hypothetical protein